jgi:hypothetical protein
MNREEALAAFAAYISEDDWPENIPSPYLDEVIFLPPSLLEQIATTDVPEGVVIGVGTYSDDAVEIFWEGRLVRTEDGSFQSVISHEISPEYWLGAISARFYLDLLHKCVQSMIGAIAGLTVEEFDDSDDVMIRLEYSFLVDGANRKYSEVSWVAAGRRGAVTVVRHVGRGA